MMRAQLACFALALTAAPIAADAQTPACDPGEYRYEAASGTLRVRRDAVGGLARMDFDAWDEQSETRDAGHFELLCGNPPGDPASDLRLALEWFAAPSSEAARDGADNYAVILELVGEAQQQRAYTSRKEWRLGEWIRRDQTARDLRIQTAISPAGIITITERDDRTLRRMQIRRLDPAQSRGGVAPLTHAPALPEAETIIAGERCVWSGERVASHQDLYTCKTADGVVLAERSLGTGRSEGTTEIRAVSLNRGAVTPEDVMAPAEWFAPETWGLPAR